MPIRDKPSIIDPDKPHFWHDWRKGDYTRLSTTVNYCSFDISKLTEVAGVYFLYINNSLVYVGKSSNLKRRIKHHISVNKNIVKSYEPSEIDKVLHLVNKIEFEIYPEEDLSWIEMFYICKLKPELNAETWKNAFM